MQRAWTVLEEKKIPYQYVEVNPYHKPESLLKLNPRGYASHQHYILLYLTNIMFGLVPTLQYDNKPLYESTVICEFLDDAYPDHGPKLLPSDPYQRAINRIWTDFVTSRIIPSFHRFLQFQPGQSQTPIDKLRTEFLDNLKQFANAMEEAGPFFFGEEPSLVDFVMAPWAVRLWVFDHYKGGLGAPLDGEGGKDNKTWSRWNKWLGAIEARSSVKETTSEREKYLSIYQK